MRTSTAVAPFLRAKTGFRSSSVISGKSEINFETFMHELGHCVEGVLSSYEMDYRCLWSVPSTAFSEGFAFTFEDRTDELLGRKSTSDDDVTTLLRFWEPYEIAGSDVKGVEIELPRGTSIEGRLLGVSADEVIAARASGVPLGRNPTIDDIVNAIMFFIADDSNFDCRSKRPRSASA